jgi:hypothetical protein
MWRGDAGWRNDASGQVAIASLFEIEGGAYRWK